MKTVAKRRSKSEASFEERYSAALCEYAAGGGETALGRAYELGRTAAGEGRSLIEIASLHHRALSALVNQAKGERRRAEMVSACGHFLAEVVSPYEMANRGFQDSVRALQRLNETLEEEIKRIAHAVHDEAGQLLVAVHLALADLSETLPESRHAQLTQVTHLLKEVENQLRRYSHELRPTILDELGWIPAVRFLADAVSKRAGLPIHVNANAAERLPSGVEVALYRIVQEALNNITKHARASRVKIQVRLEGRALRCSIEDDGAGFDVQAIRSDRKRRGLGLIGMEERLAAIGGNLRIDSSPGRGTTLSIQVPVN